MYGTPTIVYYGPDAYEVAADWCPRELQVSGVEPGDEDDVLDIESIDGLVCHTAGEGDALAVVEQVRERYPELPIVVLSSSGAVDTADAVAAGATNYVELDDGTDVPPLLASFEDQFIRSFESRRERSMFDSLLEHIPVSVFFKDDATRHIRVSDAMPSLTGPDYHKNPEGKRHPTPEDVVGKTEFDLYESAKAQRAVADDVEVMETGEPVEGEVEKCGDTPLESSYLQTYKAPWYDRDGEIIGTAGIAMDITERKRYEHRIERQNERLERFTHVLSHDLRNPLEVARGRLQFARETGDPEHFEAIETALDRMEGLVDDVLTLARQGEAVADPQPTDLETIATDAWQVVDGTNARLEIDTGRAISADPGRLRQLFENLYRNAVEHASTDELGHGAETRGATDAATGASAEASGAGSNGGAAGDAGMDAAGDARAGASGTDAGADASPAGVGAGEGSAGESPDAADSGTAGRAERITITVGSLEDGFYVADDGPGIPEDERDRVFESGYSSDPRNTGLGLSIVRTITEAHGWTVTVTESESGGARFEFRGVQPED